MQGPASVRLRRLLVGLLGAAFPAAGNASGAGVEPALALTWSAPEGCPSQEMVERDVARLVGRGRPLAPTRVIADVATIDAERWKVEIRTATAVGSATRTIVGDSCASIAEAAALFLALTVDDEGEPGGAGSTPKAESAPFSIPSAVSGAPATPRAVDKASRAPTHREGSSSQTGRHFWSSFSFGASASIDSAALPSPAFGGEITLAWRPAPVRAEVAFADWNDQSTQFTETPSIGGTFRMVSGVVRACYERSIAALILAPCAVAEIDHVQAIGYGDLTPKSGSTDWIRAGIGALGVWRASHWASIRVLFGGTTPLARPTFFVENVPVGYRPAVVSARGSLGFEVSIP